jgi:glycerophosphoryl diester phosphodiesterase
VSALLAPVVGHRGAAAHAPENTLASLRLAARQGARMLEFDAKLTSDGVVILMHDDLLERTSNGHGPVASTPWREIEKLDAGSWFGESFRGEPVPRLDQALALVLELGVDANLEIKPCPGRGPESGRAIMEVVRRCWPKDRGGLLISSFARDGLAAARDAAPEYPRGLLIWEKPADWSAAAAGLACRSIHCGALHLTPEWAAEIKRLGYDLVVYTVNDPVLARRLHGWGADSIITDRPGALRAALQGW